MSHKCAISRGRLRRYFASTTFCSHNRKRLYIRTVLTHRWTQQRRPTQGPAPMTPLPCPWQYLMAPHRSMSPQHSSPYCPTCTSHGAASPNSVLDTPHNQASPACLTLCICLRGAPGSQAIKYQHHSWQRGREKVERSRSARLKGRGGERRWLRGF